MGRKRDQPAAHRHGLAEDMANPWKNGVRPKPRTKRRKADDDDLDGASSDSDGGGGRGGRAGPSSAHPLPADLSAKVLREARAQQAEVEVEARGTRGLGGGKTAALAAALEAADATSSDSDPDAAFSDDEAGLDTTPWPAGEVHVSAEDEAALAAFAPAQTAPTRTLADVILEKIRAAEAAGPATPGGGGGPSTSGPPLHPSGLDPRVADVYAGVGRVLARYTAGRVPKALKVLPALRDWETALALTEPDMWSPHATYQATRLFVSNLSARGAQRFLALVLLPAVRADIRSNRRLHFALFQALKKAAYKPDAFFKGLLLPLVGSGTCTLREAVIVASALKRVSLPALPAAAALARLADMPYGGTTSFFIRALIDKGYALPYRVIDALVDHFTRFTTDERQMPVVWHQALLAFVTRYKHEIRADDQAALGRLCKRQYHYQVTPEVVRELAGARSRGVVGSAVAPRVGGGGGLKAAEDPSALPPVELMEDD